MPRLSMSLSHGDGKSGDRRRRDEKARETRKSMKEISIAAYQRNRTIPIGNAKYVKLAVIWFRQCGQDKWALQIDSPLEPVRTFLLPGAQTEQDARDAAYDYREWILLLYSIAG